MVNNMEFILCPLCASPKIKKKRGTLEFKIRETLITTPVVGYWYCSNCGESFLDHEANRIIDEELRLKTSRRKEIILHSLN